jgi:hypothetical protein
MESQKQLEYKAYLSTDHWKQKRLAVLSERGCQCEKCNEWGNEIHHLSYDNLWNEPLSDLMVLCRDCHEATHRALRTLNKKDKKKEKKSIHRLAIYTSLSSRQKEFLIQKYGLIDSMLHYTLGYSYLKEDQELIYEALKMIGIDNFYPKKPKYNVKKSEGRGPRYGGWHKKR